MINITEQEIMKNWKGDIDNPIVTIYCPTYNHGKYISQAIEGFLKQKTNFPFEIVIRDDASTDNTQKIILEYYKKFPNIIRPVLLKENSYKKGIRPLMEITKYSKGKYIALCDGDDYWIDEYKIQRQADFLDKNPDYGLVHTNKIKYIEPKEKFKEFYISKFSFPYSKDVENDYIYEKILNWGCDILTLTVMFKKELIYDIPKLDINKYFTGDRLFYLHISLKKKIKYLNFVSGVYRVLEESASNTSDSVRALNFRYRHANLVFYYLENYPLKNRKLEKIIINKNMFILMQYALATNDYEILKEVKFKYFSPPYTKKHLLLRFATLLSKSNKKIFDAFSNIYINRIKG